MLNPTEFYPRSVVIESTKNFNGIDNFKQDFRIVAAESFLKNFDGELTLRTLVALKIAETRLAGTRPTINDSEWMIMSMPKEKIQEHKNELID